MSSAVLAALLVSGCGKSEPKERAGCEKAKRQAASAWKVTASGWDDALQAWKSKKLRQAVSGQLNARTGNGEVTTEQAKSDQARFVEYADHQVALAGAAAKASRKAVDAALGTMLQGRETARKAHNAGYDRGRDLKSKAPWAAYTQVASARGATVKARNLTTEARDATRAVTKACQRK